MVVETTCNTLYQVRDTNDANLAHVWIGVEVKRVKGGYAPKANARETLVRKEATRIVKEA